MYFEYANNNSRYFSHKDGEVVRIAERTQTQRALAPSYGRNPVLRDLIRYMVIQKRWSTSLTLFRVFMSASIGNDLCQF